MAENFKCAVHDVMLIIVDPGMHVSTYIRQCPYEIHIHTHAPSSEPKANLKHINQKLLIALTRDRTKLENC